MALRLRNFDLRHERGQLIQNVSLTGPDTHVQLALVKRGRHRDDLHRYSV